MVAASVSSKVRVAHRGRNLLVGIESALVGLSAAIATLAAGATVRMDAGDPQARILLAVVGILGALSWWMDRSEDPRSVARSIDRRSGWAGALTTAFEAESTLDRSAVAAALAQKLAPLVSPRRFLAREARSSAAVLAAPLLALAFLGAVLEARTSQEDRTVLDPRPGSSAAALRDRSADLGARARRLAASPEVSAEDAASLEALAERAHRLGAGAVERSSPGAPVESIPELEAEMGRLARRIEASRAPVSGAGVAPVGPDGTMGGRDPRSERPADDPMRTTPPPNPPANAPALNAQAGGVEGGVGAPRWWPQRYDGVVERWIETRRASSGGRSR